MSEFGYIKEVEQSFRNNKGIFTPTDIYNLDLESKWTNVGELELIETKTVSSTVNTDFTNLGNYSTHFLTISQGLNAGANSYLGIRFSSDGGSTFDSNNNYERANYYGGTIANGNSNTSSTSIIPITSDTASDRKSGYVCIYSAVDGAQKTYVTAHYQEEEYNAGLLSGLYHGAFRCNAFRLTSNNGGAFTFKASLFGIRNP